MRFCSSCGAAFDDGARFCATCGTGRDSPAAPSTAAAAPIRPATASATPPWAGPTARQASQSQRVAWVLVAAGLSLVLVVGLVLVAVLADDDDTGSATDGTGTFDSSDSSDSSGAYEGTEGLGEDLSGEDPADYTIDSSDDSYATGVTGPDGTATVELTPSANEELTIEAFGDSDLVLSTIDIDTGSEISSDDTTTGTETIEIYTVSSDPWTITVEDYAGNAGEEFSLSVY